MIVILFFIVFVILVYLFLSTRQTVVVYKEPTPVSWWPWGITSYNWWPYWSYGSSSGIVHHKDLIMELILYLIKSRDRGEAQVVARI